MAWWIRPGPNVLYVKMALTDLSLERKKRRLLAYTPVGFVLKAGADSLRDMMEKYDIMGVAAQGQMADSHVEPADGRVRGLARQQRSAHRPSIS